MARLFPNMLCEMQNEIKGNWIVTLQGGDIYHACVAEDRSLCAFIMVSLAERLLPIWEARFPADEKMPRLVMTMSQWLDDPSDENHIHVQTCCDAVTAKRGGYFLSPITDWPEPWESVTPGELAGDAIVHASNVVVRIKEDTYDLAVKDAIENAIESIARMLEANKPHDETYHYGEGLKQLREYLIERLTARKQLTML